MLVMGDLSLQGNSKTARSLVGPLHVATDVIDEIDPIFRNDVKTTTFKGLDLN